MFENEFTWGKAVVNNSTSEFHENYEDAFQNILSKIGGNYPLIIASEKIFTEKKFEVHSPADRRILLGKFSIASVEDTKKSIISAKHAFKEWSKIDYKKRADVFKQCADSFSKRKFELAALLSLENGKNRYEAMGDIDEAIDFLRFYSEQLEQNEGFCKETQHPNPKEKTRIVLKPYGVWGIISPFNFPSAIAIGMTTGALLTGNTTVLKPASASPLSSYEFVNEIYLKLPKGVINFVTGSGSIVGQTIIDSYDVDGIAFTGSREVGFSGFKRFTEKTFKPYISEMGGKNPVIVTKNADLEKAAEGIVRASFGYGGQKCSACSRVYAQKEIFDTLTRIISEKTKNIKVGLPWQRDVFLGPLIDSESIEKFKQAIDTAKQSGKIIVGGNVLSNNDFTNGFYVEPTVISDLPENSRLLKDELFLPLVCIEKYDDLDDAIKKANNTEYGLTAGIFSNDQNEVEKFFDMIEAGTIYANRESSATTAALVRAQPFVGWKSSGSTGVGAGGDRYLHQFMRAQTQTRCE